MVKIMRESEVKLWLISELHYYNQIDLWSFIRHIFYMTEQGEVYAPYSGWIHLIEEEWEKLNRLIHKRVYPEPSREELRRRTEYKIRRNEELFFGRDALERSGLR